MRHLPKQNLATDEKKAKSLAKLRERYHGKDALLATWDKFGQGIDPKYRNDLKRRVQTHKNDLTYRGGL